MSKEDKGGSAFPFTVFQENGARCSAPGMTLRDYFAAKAMQGMCAAPMGKFPYQLEIESIACDTYKMADAMLEARKK